MTFIEFDLEHGISKKRSEELEAVRKNASGTSTDTSMEPLELLISFAATAFINIMPALIIRYLIRRKRFETKKSAIIACIVIAIVAWTIIYIISFSDIGSKTVPKGTPEIIFAFVNYYILKPKTSSSSAAVKKEKVDSEKNETSPITDENKISPMTDENMKAYADIILCDDEPTATRKPKPQLHKFTIILVAVIATLSISTIVLGTMYSNASGELEEVTIQLEEVNNRLKTLRSQDADEIMQSDKFESVAKFFYDAAVFTNDSDNHHYHRYDCPQFDDSYYYIYNVENAEAKGYTPCSYCHSLLHRSNVLYID